MLRRNKQNKMIMISTGLFLNPIQWPSLTQMDCISVRWTSLTHSTSEEVNQGMQIQPMAMGLLNIAMAYHADDEEEDLQLVDNNLHLNVAE